MTTIFHAPASATDLPIEDTPGALAQGDDRDDVLHEIKAVISECIVINSDPVHPATHGALRLAPELGGKKIHKTHVDAGYLRTGIEKNMEYHTWAQGVAYYARMDYVAPFFQEAICCLGVEKLLGIEEDIPGRVSLIHILMMELYRTVLHPATIGSTGNEMGTTTITTIDFRTREEILHIFGRITSLRVSHECIRPDGVVQDTGGGIADYIRDRLRRAHRDVDELQDTLMKNPILKKCLCGVAVISLSGFVTLDITGLGVRTVGLPPDLCRNQLYCDHENFRLDVSIHGESDAYNRTMIRFNEYYGSMHVIWQVPAKLGQCEDIPTMVADSEITWPTRLTVGTDGQGNSAEHVREITGESIESLIHHFELITEDFHVPAGQVYQTVEHAKGILDVHLVSNDGTRPLRTHPRDPSYASLQALAIITEGSRLTDAVVVLVTINPALGGTDQ